MPDVDKTKQSGSFQRKIIELENRIKALEDLVTNGSTKTVYVASTSGGAVTTELTVEKGIVK